MRTALLEQYYHDHLVDSNEGVFAQRVSQRYTIGTLERLATGGKRLSRRAATLALGLLGDFSSNAVLGRALVDSDRGVRLLADSGIRLLWCRCGTASQRQILDAVIRLNCAERYKEAIKQATSLIRSAPDLAEAWNQRALAYFNLGRFKDSIHDCREALERNPYHFGAASGLGQCHLKLGDQQAALENLQRALQLNPVLEGVRTHILYLRRILKSE